MTCTYPPGLNKNVYSPELVGGPLPQMPLLDDTLTFRDSILLQYPADTPTTTLELRNPELNDKFVFQAYRVSTYSRGDTQILFRDPTWFTNRIYNWAFTALTAQNRLDIISFVRTSAGKYVLVTDYLSRVYTAIIINPDNPITQELPDYDQQPTIPPTDPLPLPGMGYTWKVDLQRKLV